MSCFVYICVAALSTLVALVLLIHHHQKHSDRNSPDYLPHTTDQWFQVSDCLRCNLCSHEFWVVLAMVNAAVFWGLSVDGSMC